MLPWLAGVALVAATGPALDPAWRIDTFGVEDGLPIVHTMRVEVDTLGFVWVATLEGLFRFDGARFEPFRRDQMPGLRIDRIVDLERDPGDGALWIADEVGTVCRVDPRLPEPAGSARCWELGATKLAKSAGGVWAYGDAGGTHRLSAAGPERVGSPDLRDFLGAGRDGSALVVDGTGAVHRVYDGGRDEVLPGPRSDSGAIAPDGAAWTVPEGGAALRFSPASGVARPEAEGAWRVAWLRGHLWVFGDHRGWRVDGDRLVPEPLPLVPADETEWVEMDAGGHLWQGGEGRLLRDGVVLARDLPSGGFAEDGAGGAWISSRWGLKHVRAAVARSFSPSGPFREASQVIALGGGVLTGYRTTWGSWRQTVDSPEVRTRPGAATGAGVFARDASGGVVASDGTAVCRMVRGTCVEALPPLPSWSEVLAFDRKGRVWAGGGDGTYVLDGPAWREVFGPAGERLARVRNFFPLDERMLATEWGRGLLSMDPGGRARRRGATEGIPSVDIRAFWRDLDGALWLGTEDAGLCRLGLDAVPDPMTAPVVCADATAGALDREVSDLRPDGAGRLWLASNRGLLVLSVDSLRRWVERGEWIPAVRVDHRDGLRSRDTNAGYGKADTDSQGGLWYPLMDGIARVDPTLLRVAPLPAPRILRASAGNRRLDPVDLHLDRGAGALRLDGARVRAP